MGSLQTLEGRVRASGDRRGSAVRRLPVGTTATVVADREDESLAAKETDPSSGEEWLASEHRAHVRPKWLVARISSFSRSLAERAGFVSELVTPVNVNGPET
jgi:hypothetical protein